MNWVIFPNDFDYSGRDRKPMSRWAGGGKVTCESCKAIDVRRWHRSGHLATETWFSQYWTCDGEASGNISVRATLHTATLNYRVRQHGDDWESVRQEIPIVWTRCTLGGERPWFRCVVYASGVYCGRRVAKLYAAGKLFACRHCYRLAYASQQETARYRGVSQAQKIRMRLGCSGNLFDPFPPKPKGMHWSTYQRLEDRAYAAETEADAHLAAWFLRRCARR